MSRESGERLLQMRVSATLAQWRGISASTKRNNTPRHFRVVTRSA
jgi:hypothetical protein